MYNATSYHHSYEDSGLLCIHASADPRQVVIAAYICLLVAELHHVVFKNWQLLSSVNGFSL